jgi:3D (Asp-Asp-Asp) domain-containing protein
MQIQFALLSWRMRKMVKAISVGLALFALCCLAAFNREIQTDFTSLSVAGGSSVTETIKVTKVAKPKDTMIVVATAYCPCAKCCGKWANGITASGKTAKANHTIAVDKRLIPLGTKVIINGKTYVAEDTGGAIKGNKIDIYVSDHSTALRLGVYYAEVYLAN